MNYVTAALAAVTLCSQMLHATPEEFLLNPTTIYQLKALTARTPSKKHKQKLLKLLKLLNNEIQPAVRIRKYDLGRVGVGIMFKFQNYIEEKQTQLNVERQFLDYFGLNEAENAIQSYHSALHRTEIATNDLIERWDVILSRNIQAFLNYNSLVSKICTNTILLLKTSRTNYLSLLKPKTELSAPEMHSKTNFKPPKKGPPAPFGKPRQFPARSTWTRRPKQKTLPPRIYAKYKNPPVSKQNLSFISGTGVQRLKKAGPRGRPFTSYFPNPQLFGK